MSFFQNILHLFKRPFPEEDNIFKYLRTLLFFSFFVTFFLYVFQPFGLDTLETSRFLICLGFGSMTIIGAVVYEYTIGALLKRLGIQENWTFGKWILNNLGIMIFISFANFLYARLVIFGYIQWDLFPTMMYGTFMIGIIPLVVFGGLIMMNQEKRFQVISHEINAKKSVHTENNRIQELSIFNIPTRQIKYVEALQNYVKIGYLNEEGNFSELTERTTLKSILEQVEGSSIIKCHRSFLVNKEAIISTSGNAQGLLLSLSNCNKIVPVSRSCVALFR